jgi:hypothetical protein
VLSQELVSRGLDKGGVAERGLDELEEAYRRESWAVRARWPPLVQLRVKGARPCGKVARRSLLKQEVRPEHVVEKYGDAPTHFDSGQNAFGWHRSDWTRDANSAAEGAALEGEATAEETTLLNGSAWESWDGSSDEVHADEWSTTTPESADPEMPVLEGEEVDDPWKTSSYFPFQDEESEADVEGILHANVWRLQDSEQQAEQDEEEVPGSSLYTYVAPSFDAELRDGEDMLKGCSANTTTPPLLQDTDWYMPHAELGPNLSSKPAPGSELPVSEELPLTFFAFLRKESSTLTTNHKNGNATTAELFKHPPSQEDGHEDRTEEALTKKLEVLNLENATQGPAPKISPAPGVPPQKALPPFTLEAFLEAVNTAALNHPMTSVASALNGHDENPSRGAVDEGSRNPPGSTTPTTPRSATNPATALLALLLPPPSTSLCPQSPPTPPHSPSSPSALDTALSSESISIPHSPQPRSGSLPLKHRPTPFAYALNHHVAPGDYLLQQRKVAIKMENTREWDRWIEVPGTRKKGKGKMVDGTKAGEWDGTERKEGWRWKGRVEMEMEERTEGKGWGEGHVEAKEVWD